MIKQIKKNLRGFVEKNKKTREKLGSRWVFQTPTRFFLGGGIFFFFFHGSKCFKEKV